MAKGFDAMLLLGVQLAEDGSATPELIRRTETAAQLYREGKAPLIVACGGTTPGRSVSEADVMARLLQEMGVPAQAVIREDKSQDTIGNMRFAAEKLGGAKKRRVLVVTSDYHLRRSVMTARRAGFAARGYPARLEHDEAWRTLKGKELAYTVDMLMGWQDEGKRRPAWTYRLFDLVFKRKS